MMIRKPFTLSALCCGMFLSLGFFSSTVFPATHDVTVGNDFFSPNDLTIKVGDTVRWTNNANRMHDVTADDFSWNSVTSSSFVFERTFNSIEEVLYHCTVHSAPGRNINTSQNGRINVTQATQNQPPNAAFSSACAGLGCNFTDQSTDSDGTISSWSWSFGDDITSSMQNPDHNYAAAGTYTVTLAVTDNGGDSDSSSNMVTVEAPLPGLVLINAGMTDAWLDQATSGQGFFIIVWEGIEFIFLSWFTFDTERPPDDVTAIFGEPGHRWVTAQGPYDGDTATLDVFLSAGGVLDSEEPETVTDPEPIGTITIQWTSCTAGMLTYNIPSLGLMGEIPISRIVDNNVALCEAGQNSG
jgi:PKD repeat protein